MNNLSRGKKLGIQILIICLVCLIFGVSSSLLSGCTKGCRKSLKHTKSKYIGLKRKITWYDYNREVIRTWEGRLSVEMAGSGIAFEDKNKKETKLFGGLILVEEQ